jgi:xanthine dehydrogenase iron-sulfur cluster and FAD-binding subunit A
LDGVLGSIACFITLEPILKALSKNLNQRLDVAGVGQSAGLVGKSLTQCWFCVAFLVICLPALYLQRQKSSSRCCNHPKNAAACACFVGAVGLFGISASNF